jgi:P27 family predicted phage terminase small subunit
MRGRKPNYKTLQDRAKDNKPQAPLAVPRCPAVLKGEAKNEWRRMTGLLFEQGIIADLDRSTLAIHCAAWARWVQAENEINTIGPVVKGTTGAAVVSPWCAISQAAARTMKEILGEFGLSPASRARLLGERKPEERHEATGFEGVLAGVA